MEFTELQAMWQQYDARIAENTRINKEILKRMLRTKPERRMQWMRWWAIYGIVVLIPCACIALIPNTKFRNEWDFYTGLVLIVFMMIKTLYMLMQRYHIIKMINFTNPMIQIKKSIIQLEEYSAKMKKVNYVLMIIGMVGVCLMCKLPVLTKEFAIVTIIVFTYYFSTTYYYSKKLKNRLYILNAELDELEELEKE